MNKDTWFRKDKIYLKTKRNVKEREGTNSRIKVENPFRKIILQFSNSMRDK
tara:strand:+ start:944 stop:1096 length:153 start_codon:yes stop_codon:yes gene_type:complete